MKPKEKAPLPIYKSDPEWDVEFREAKKGCPAYFRGYHYIGTLGYSLHVVLSPTVHGAKEIGKKNGLSGEIFDEMGDAEACCVHGAGVVVLWFRPDSNRRASILTHEVYHACRYIAEARELPLSVDAQEPMAYLTGHINGIVCNMLYEMEQFIRSSRQARTTRNGVLK